MNFYEDRDPRSCPRSHAFPTLRSRARARVWVRVSVFTCVPPAGPRFALFFSTDHGHNRHATNITRGAIIFHQAGEQDSRQRQRAERYGGARARARSTPTFSALSANVDCVHTVKLCRSQPAESPRFAAVESLSCRSSRSKV